MKLLDALLKAKELNLSYVAIDPDGDVCGFEEKPIYGMGLKYWIIGKTNTKCAYLGKYDGKFENYETAVFEV